MVFSWFFTRENGHENDKQITDGLFDNLEV